MGDNVDIAQWAKRRLSEERLEPYLRQCDGDIDRAIELYEWNISLGEVLMRDVSHFEVAIRNSYDRVMTERWDGSEHWLLDDDSPARRPVMRSAARGQLDVNRINRKIIDDAVARLRPGFTSGSLVASLTLGFWVHLSDRSREAVIWRTGLYRAWPKGTNRAELQRSLDAILKLRNRIAHNERLFDPSKPELSPLRVDSDLVRLFAALCPEAEANANGGSGSTPVEAFLQKNPAPADVVL